MLPRDVTLPRTPPSRAGSRTRDASEWPGRPLHNRVAGPHSQRVQPTVWGGAGELAFPLNCHDADAVDHTRPAVSPITQSVSFPLWSLPPGGGRQERLGGARIQVGTTHSLGHLRVASLAPFTAESTVCGVGWAQKTLGLPLPALEFHQVNASSYQLRPRLQMLGSGPRTNPGDWAGTCSPSHLRPNSAQTSQAHLSSCSHVS